MRSIYRFIVNLFYLIGAWILIGLGLGSLGLGVIFVTFSDMKNAMIFGGVSVVVLILILPFYIPLIERIPYKKTSSFLYSKTDYASNYMKEEKKQQRTNKKTAKKDVGNVSYTNNKDIRFK